MKFMTETKDGGRVVEMTPREVSEFRRLVLAVEGKELLEAYNSGFLDSERIFYDSDHPDMGNTFSVIHNWFVNKCNLNEIEHALAGLRRALEPKHD